MAERAFGKRAINPALHPFRTRVAASWVLVGLAFVLCVGGLYTFYHFEMQRPERVAAAEEAAARVQQAELDQKESFEYWHHDHYYDCYMLLRSLSSSYPKAPVGAKSKLEAASRRFATECETLDFEEAMWLRRLEIKLKYNFTSAPGRYWNNEVFLFPEGWRLGDEKNPARMREIHEQHKKR